MLIAWRDRPQEAPRTVRYQVTDVGTIVGCDVTYSTGINDSGWVAGYAYTYVPPGHGNNIMSRPFAWHNQTLTELPKLGGEHGQALAINAQGDLAGYATTPAYADKPVFWTRAKRYQPTRLSKLSGRATCLLDDGTAAGFVVRNKSNQAVVWEKGKMRVLGNPRDMENICNSINGKGTAVGFFIPEGHISQSFMSPGDRHAVMWKDGLQIVLPELGGALSECNAINEAGTAVGWSDDKNGRTACAWKDKKVEALPTMDGYNTEAYSINRGGTIVGEALERSHEEGWKWLACMWHEGKLEDLNKLIPANSGWKLSVASRISDSGLIVGYGTCDKYPNHQWRAFLLTPVER